jgi:hypothetical protein
MMLIVAALHDDTAKYGRRSTADEINMAQQARIQSTLVWLAETSGRPLKRAFSILTTQWASVTRMSKTNTYLNTASTYRKQRR